VNTARCRGGDDQSLRKRIADLADADLQAAAVRTWPAAWSPMAFLYRRSVAGGANSGKSVPGLSRIALNSSAARSPLPGMNGQFLNDLSDQPEPNAASLGAGRSRSSVVSVLQAKTIAARSH